MIAPLLRIGLLLIMLVAATIVGLVGFGSAVILLPVCASAFGATQAAPILTVAGIIMVLGV